MRFFVFFGGRNSYGSAGKITKNMLHYRKPGKGGAGNRMTKQIYSRNAAYQKFEVLKTNRHKRYKYYEFFVEGVRGINQAVENGWQIASFLYDGKRKLSGWAETLLQAVDTEVNYELTAELMEELSSKEDGSELLAVVKMRQDNPDAVPLSANPLLAVFDRPSNKGNLGTIIRSCDAFGLDALLLTGHAVDLYDPDVISSSMGSFFHMPVIRISDNGTLFDFIEKVRGLHANLQVVGTTAHSETRLDGIDFTRPTVLMIGNETDGLNRTLKQSCDVLAAIPMAESSSATSFNVGCAATVCFYEAVRQRI